MAMLIYVNGKQKTITVERIGNRKHSLFRRNWSFKFKKRPIKRKNLPLRKYGW